MSHGQMPLSGYTTAGVNRLRITTAKTRKLAVNTNRRPDQHALTGPTCPHPSLSHTDKLVPAINVNHHVFCLKMRSGRTAAHAL